MGALSMVALTYRVEVGEAVGTEAAAVKGKAERVRLAMHSRRQVERTPALCRSNAPSSVRQSQLLTLAQMQSAEIPYLSCSVGNAPASRN